VRAEGLENTVMMGMGMEGNQMAKPENALLNAQIND